MKSEQIKCTAGCLSQSLQKVRHAENQCQCKLSSILLSHRNPWCLNPFPSGMSGSLRRRGPGDVKL